MINQGTLDNYTGFYADNEVISPNGDNLNDYLVFDEVNEYTHSKLVIYNQRGGGYCIPN
ncbi:T9SS type B sorting domain-containing protein [Tenacibaculum sediminilitoris]|uniref:T9SS type B sorting domain-containing protein n=1 Tax=Tenacibaculum sediminilitoris TaxID=1820334 RepID=UPI0038B65E7E